MACFSVLSVLCCLLLTVSVDAAAVVASSRTTISSTSTYPAVYPTAVLSQCPTIDQYRYVTPKGVFQITCSWDYYGLDLARTGQKVASFQACIDKCAANAECKAITFVTAAGTCWLKGSIPTGRKSSASWGAKWIANALPVVSSSTSSISSTNPLSTSVATSSGNLPAVSPSSSSTSTPPKPTTSASPSSSATVLDPTSGTESVLGPAETIAGPPPAILGPVSPPNIDPTSLDIITPNAKQGLFYKGPTDAEGSTVAKLSVSFKYPTVVLDHSSHITTTCQNGGLTATFDTAAAFQQAQSTWPSTAFILVTAKSSCSTDGQNVFYLTSKVVFNVAGKTATASGAITELADVFGDVGLDFGAIPDTTNTGNLPAVNNCGTPGASIINGLPAVACGSAFDKTLDDQLGYYSSEEADFAATMAVLSPGSTSGIQRRGFFSAIKAAVKYVAPYVAPVIQKAIAYVAPYIPPVIQKAVVYAATVVAKVVVAVVETVAAFLTGDFSQSLTLPIKIAPSAGMLISSPWGNQLKFYEYKVGDKDAKYTASKAALAKIGDTLLGEKSPVPGVDLFCVDCGINGALKATGSVSISATDGFYKGTISLEGNMEAGLFLGVNAFAQWEKKLEKEIIKTGLPGFSIPKVVTIGPSLALGVEAGLNIEAVGQVLVGTSYSWPAISATLDLIDKTKSKRSGFSPIVTKKFEAYGDVTATASLGLPVTVAFGVDFFSGKWKKEAALKNVPSLNAVAKFSVTLGTAGNNVITDGCKGIAWNVNLANEVDLELGDDEYKLWEWEGPVLAQGCLGRTVPEESSSSSSSFITSTTSRVSSSTLMSSSSASAASATLPQPSSQSLSSTVLLIAPLSQLTSVTAPTSSLAQFASSTVLLVAPLASSTALISSVSSQSTSSAMSSTVLMVAPISSSVSGALSSSASYVSTAVLSSLSQTSSSATSTASLAVASNAPINCPADNGKNFVDSKGYTYQIKCHTDLPGDDIANAQLGSFDECIESCFSSQNHDCVAVSWLPERSSSNCNYKGDRQALPSEKSDASLGVTVHSAVLIAAPACSTLSCPANSSQYCSSNNQLFKMSCEIAYQTDALGGFNLKTLGECIDKCSSGWPGVCNGVVFFAAQYRASTAKSFPTTNCYPFASGDNPVSYDLAAGGTSALTRNARNIGQGLWKRTFEVDAMSQRRSVAALPSTPHGRTALDDMPAEVRKRQVDTSGDLTYTSLLDVTNTLSLNAASNGNLFVTTATDTVQKTDTTFAISNNVIMGDSLDRLFHYFPSEAGATGASRLRLAAWGSIPKTAELISLAAIGSKDSNMLAAVDSRGNSFFMYVCAINGQQNKVFLSKDLVNGAAILQDPSLKFTVTGGVVNDCVPLVLKSTALTAFVAS